MKQAIAAVVLALAGVTGIVLLVGRSAGEDPGGGDTATSSSSTSTTLSTKDQEERDRTQAWEREALAAFGGQEITDRVLEMVKGADDVAAGVKDVAEYRAELDLRVAEFKRARDALAAVRPFPYDARVAPLYLESARLYLETARVYQVLATTPAGDLRTQLDRLARRTRVLADRVFDRGRELLKPHLHEAPNPDVKVELPEEVPNWVEESVAPGPPLDDPPPEASGDPALRAETRPDQPRDRWLAAVRDARIPSGAELRAAVEAADPTALRDVARRLVASAEHLRRVPDPKGDREESARARLAILVHAEAARAAQAGALAGRPELGRVARRLGLIGDRIWAGPGLPDRATGFDPAVLGED